MSQRKQRVAERIKQELSQIIHDQIKDPRVGFVTITRVDLNDDLRYAKVFYSVLGDEEKKKEAAQGLNSAKNFIRKLLGESLDIRYTPDFSFKLDDSIEYNMHISKIFDKIAAEREEKEGKTDDTKQILDKLEQFESFLIIAHIHPEGDSIGSQLAMSRLLKSMNKKVQIINSDRVPKNLMFLPGAEKVRIFDENKGRSFDFDAAVILDCPTLERIGQVRQLLEGLFLISIDHHISNQGFADINWTDAHASSAGEMVYELFKQSRMEIDEKSALCLYVAIMTDTGSFRYSNTTVKTHHIIAELLKYNVNPVKVYETIYETKSYEVMKLLAEVLMNLKRSDGGKCVWFRVTDEMLKRNNLTAEATEDFIAFVRMVEGAEVVAFLREVDSGSKVKVSLRSKTDIDVNKIAGFFGGGGHHAASGCLIEEDIDKAEQMLISRIKKSIKEHNGN